MLSYQELCLGFQEVSSLASLGQIQSFKRVSVYEITPIYLLRKMVLACFQSFGFFPKAQIIALAQNTISLRLVCYTRYVKTRQHPN